MSTFLSIILATIRPKRIVDYLNNLAETAKNPQSFEVLIQIDDDDKQTQQALFNIIPTLPFQCRFFSLPKKRGYYSLHVGYDYMLTQMSPSSKFAWIHTDEIRMKSFGWDEKLVFFIDYFADGVFRLRPTEYKMRNYYCLEECINSPDNHPIVSKTWLNLTGGWGEFWAPDTWHQCLDYHFGLVKHGVEAKFRAMPIFEFEMGGLEHGIAEDGSAETGKAWMNINGCHIMESHLGRENFARLGQRLYGHIIACEKGYNEYYFEENYNKKSIKFFDKNNSIIYQANYNLPKQITDELLNLKIIEATSQDIWEKAHQEIQQRSPKQYFVSKNSEQTLDSASNHLKLLMDSLNRPTSIRSHAGIPNEKLTLSV